MTHLRAQTLRAQSRSPLLGKDPLRHSLRAPHQHHSITATFATLEYTPVAVACAHSVISKHFQVSPLPLPPASCTPAPSYANKVQSCKKSRAIAVKSYTAVATPPPRRRTARARPRQERAHDCTWQGGHWAAGSSMRVSSYEQHCRRRALMDPFTLGAPSRHSIAKREGVEQALSSSVANARQPKHFTPRWGMLR